MPEESVLAQITLDTVKVEKLVREFLSAQTLQILPQNTFGDAVSQFVDKDDKHAMEAFVTDSLADSVKDLVTGKKKKAGTDEADEEEEEDEEALIERLGERKSHLEELFDAGHRTRATTAKLKPKPTHWDSDMDGHWADNAAAIIRSEGEEDDEDDEEDGSEPPAKASARGRGKAAASTRGAKKATRGRATAAKTTTTRGKKKVVEEEESEEEDDDVVMLDDDDDEDEPFARPKATKAAASKTASKAPAKKAPARAAAAPRAAARQTQLSFAGSQLTSQAASQRPAARGAASRAQEIVGLAAHLVEYC